MKIYSLTTFYHFSEKISKIKIRKIWNRLPKSLTKQSFSFTAARTVWTLTTISRRIASISEPLFQARLISPFGRILNQDSSNLHLCTTYGSQWSDSSHLRFQTRNHSSFKLIHKMGSICQVQIQILVNLKEKLTKKG